MILVKAVITLISWPEAICFSPDPLVHLPGWPHTSRTNANGEAGKLLGRQRQQHGRRLTAVLLSQSVNDNNGGFHYDQEPRGQSFISQFSKQDLWERRQRKGARPRRPQRRPAPNSRGAVVTPRIKQEHYAPENVGSSIESSSRGNEFGEFENNVSANLVAMTDLLKEMSSSQMTQTNEVQTLALKVASMSDRLSMTEKKNRILSQDSPGGMGNQNFGTNLDGSFHQKIKNVIDEFDVVSAAHDSRGGVGQQGGEYYRKKIAQLESKVNRIDEALRATEEKVDSKMEDVDIFVSETLGDINDAAFDSMQFQPPPQLEPFLDERPPLPPQPLGDATFGSMQFQQPPQPQPFLDERPPPPTPPPGDAAFESMQFQQPPQPQPFFDERPVPPPPPIGELPSPPPPPQTGFDNPSFVNDSSRYYQERSYNESRVPPSRMPEMSSMQNQQSNNSVNESSGGHHYNQMNRSFMSSFSKADNQYRRQLDPWRNQRTQGQQWQRSPPPYRGQFPTTSPEPMLPEYFEESNVYEDGPMMGEDYFYDDMMHGF